MGTSEGDGSMMELHQVDMISDAKTMLKSIDFSWRKGEAIALMGANGAGKSTLLKVIITLLKPTAGRISFPAGMDSQQWRSCIGTVFPETFLYEPFSAWENLNFYSKLYGISDQQKAEKVLDQVGLYPVRHHPVHSYSKGMKQRLSIARALLHDPGWLILDEPFDGLDLSSQEVLKDLLKQYKKNGVGWVLVSHDTDQLWNLCDRAVLMNQGAIASEVTCERGTLQPLLQTYHNVMSGSRHAFS
jgi:heme exporter protein A